MNTVNGNGNEVYGMKYENSLDAASSSVNSCSVGVICATNSPQILADGTILAEGTNSIDNYRLPTRN
ncbi:MAG: hypothetical protein WA941_11445 [Nitrososphaeraceae archaeon]